MDVSGELADTRGSLLAACEEGLNRLLAALLLSRWSSPETVCKSLRSNVECLVGCVCVRQRGGRGSLSNFYQRQMFDEPAVATTLSLL